MLSGPGQFAENETNEVNFREIPSHVLHLQGEVHQQLHRDSRISHPARNRSRTTHGSQFFGLLEKKKTLKRKKRTKPRKQKFSKKKTQK